MSSRKWQPYLSLPQYVSCLTTREFPPLYLDASMYLVYSFFTDRSLIETRLYFSRADLLQQTIEYSLHTIHVQSNLIIIRPYSQNTPETHSIPRPSDRTMACVLYVDCSIFQTFHCYWFNGTHVWRDDIFYVFIVLNAQCRDLLTTSFYKNCQRYELKLYNQCKLPQTSSISRTKSENLNVSRLVLELFLSNPVKPGVSVAQWRYSWSSADKRCSNYIWVINNFIASLRFKGICVYYTKVYRIFVQQLAKINNKTIKASHYSHCTRGSTSHLSITPIMCQ